MAYTTIDDPSAYFQTLLYTGNGSSQTMTNDGNSDLQPDFLWIKQRSGIENHYLGNSSIANKFLNSDRTDAESTNVSGKELTYNSDGFAFAGSDSTWNGSSSTYVAWQWKANGGTTASNSDGSITSTVQANTTAGFSIITFTADGGSKTVGHGLNSTPVLTIRKKRDATADWFVHTTIIDGSMDYLKLNTTAAASGSSLGAFTSTVSAADDNTNTYVVYCFHSVQGFSKFGSYTGNGSTDGPFVYTGFKPAFVIQKQTNAAGEYWMMKDSTREPFNQADANIYPNATNVEGDTNGIDFLSNGFKCRTDGAGSNADGATYIYMSFAESPFVSSEGVPTTAR